MIYLIEKALPLELIARCFDGRFLQTSKRMRAMVKQNPLLIRLLDPECREAWIPCLRIQPQIAIDHFLEPMSQAAESVGSTFAWAGGIEVLAKGVPKLSMCMQEVAFPLLQHSIGHGTWYQRGLALESVLSVPSSLRAIGVMKAALVRGEMHPYFRVLYYLEKFMDLHKRLYTHVEAAAEVMARIVIDFKCDLPIQNSRDLGYTLVKSLVHSVNTNNRMPETGRITISLTTKELPPFIRDYGDATFETSIPVIGLVREGHRELMLSAYIRMKRSLQLLPNGGPQIEKMNRLWLRGFKMTFLFLCETFSLASAVRAKTIRREIAFLDRALEKREEYDLDLILRALEVIWKVKPSKFETAYALTCLDRCTTAGGWRTFAAIQDLLRSIDRYSYEAVQALALLIRGRERIVPPRWRRVFHMQDVPHSEETRQQMIDMVVAIRVPSGAIALPLRRF